MKPTPKEIKESIIKVLSETDESFFRSMKFERVGYDTGANEYRAINKRVNSFLCTGYKIEISKKDNL